MKLKVMTREDVGFALLGFALWVLLLFSRKEEAWNEKDLVNTNDPIAP